MLTPPGTEEPVNEAADAVLKALMHMNRTKTRRIDPV
jgi:hypothetical protein